MHNKLKEMKESAHMSTKELSKKSGVPEATISRILSGQTENPCFYNVCDIVVALGGSVDDIIDNQTSSPPQKQDALIELYEKNLAHERKTIKMLSIILAVVFTIIFIVLIYDLLHPNIGYFVK